MILETRAYAKINLGLLVHGKRPDGFHEIETIFHRIDLYDGIRLESSGKISIETDSDEVPANESNLCWKAANLINAVSEGRHGVRISIRKRIPVGAGLGGGSSDAAAVLKLLPRLWNLQITEGHLMDCATRLGSDVPFFLGSTSAHGTGRGERLVFFPLQVPFALLVCYPEFQVSTAWAYGQIKEYSRHRPGGLKERLLGVLNYGVSCDVFENNFERPVFAHYPRLAGLRDSLIEAGAICAALSGSGSSVYGIFRDDTMARQAAVQIEGMGYRAFYTAPGFQTPV